MKVRDCFRQPGRIKFGKIVLKFPERLARIEKHFFIRHLLISDRILYKFVYAEAFLVLQKGRARLCGDYVQRFNAAGTQMLRHAADVFHQTVGVGKDAGIHLLQDIPLFRRRDEQREVDMSFAVGTDIRHFSQKAEAVRRFLIFLRTIRHLRIPLSLL